MKINPTFEIHGLVFDLDGVLVDSEPLHIKAWQQTFRTVGRDFDYQWFDRWIGITDRRMVTSVVTEYGFPADPDELLENKRALYHQLVAGGLQSFEGVPERLLRFSEIPLAVATSSSRADSEEVLRTTALQPFFKTVVTADDVARPKPDPECYLLAVEILGLKPGGCVAVEDSFSGIAAAKRAGLFVLAVENSVPREFLQEADLIFPTTPHACDWIIDRISS